MYDMVRSKMTLIISPIYFQSDVGDRSRNLKFSTHHQDQSMEFTSNERGGVHLHTLVDRERKRSRERG